ncbi:MAG: HRDC domain-containing protein [Bacteroidales bacterium]|nr:HRDC domain-containing protein [Bacteroidales bacterium]
MDNIYNKENNPEAWLAWQLVSQTSMNIFLTGKAGTGKTTFLHNLHKHSPKRMAIVAPTGVAAINAGGVTIHSFFQLPFSPFIPGAKLKTDYTMRKEKINIIRTLDLLVIDEISMVRADLLDAVDTALRHFRRNNSPFGGVQLLMIGDIQQLPPVVVESERHIIESNYPTPYFFSCHALNNSPYVIVELNKVYRQNDQSFVQLLNNIRDNHIDDATLDALNARYKPEFDPDDNEGYIRLTTHNNQADSVNNQKLDLLPSPEAQFNCQVTGNFPETSYPADKVLKIKVGAQVMFLKNDKSGEHRYYNGKIGKVTDFNDKTVTVKCLADNIEVIVEYEEWANTHYKLDPETNEISEEIEGVFKQLPLRLAWAVTIHKSQGLTFDKAIIDAQQSFAHGQVYVALSRCRTLEGIVLSSRITEQSVICDSAVTSFICSQSSRTPSENNVEDMKAEYAVELIKQLFNFRHITSSAFRIERLLDENCINTLPKLIAELKALLTFATNEIISVSDQFLTLCTNKRMEGTDIRTDEQLMNRVKKGADYFTTKVTSILSDFVNKTDIEIDRKDVSKPLDELRKQMDKDISVKLAELNVVAKEGFDTELYLKTRAQAIIECEKTTKKPKEKNTQTYAISDISNHKLYAKIVAWRRQKAAELDVPAFHILTQKTVIEIAAKAPQDLSELKKVSGIGPTKLKQFGEEIITLITSNTPPPKK